MANRWGNSGNSERLYLSGSKITASGSCSAEIKIVGSWRKIITNVYSIWKSRDITFPKKMYLVKVLVFPVVMYGCESLTIKKAEHWRFDAFKLQCWRRLLRVPWTARKSNQSILKEISLEIFTGRTDAKAEAPLLWPPDMTHWKRPWCWKRLKAEG